LTDANEQWARRLIREYRKGRKQLEAYRVRIKSRAHELERQAADIAELQIVGGMIIDMDYAVSHMQRYVGQPRTPKPTRLDRRLFPALDIEPERRLTRDERQRMMDLLAALSEREQQCLLLHFAHGMSYGKIGAELGVTKAMVQQSVNRAKKKILS